jgi:hypothetical protein
MKGAKMEYKELFYFALAFIFFAASLWDAQNSEHLE